ncbi:hypothetical protein PMI14_03202 [Acidovorax sp. CF316]|uniref:hypothetical protein n=1 Tax=Acidovorax sp. CF316 TaxID=1144317 RepID=UPI00026BDB67|nr:hypothetical protein [Acidovorax sp. CF316]EJE52091.1 hypothetical protein PMI14_03202 [Acidovorax sp. CF316]
MKKLLLLLLALVVSHGALAQASEAPNLDAVQLPPMARPVASPAAKGATSQALVIEPTYFYTYLLSTSTGTTYPTATQSIGYLTRNDAFLQLTGYLGCTVAGTFIPFDGYFADRYNCPFYNGIIVVAWAPNLVYTPWIWYYYLIP